MEVYRHDPEKRAEAVRQAQELTERIVRGIANPALSAMHVEHTYEHGFEDEVIS